MQCKCTGLTKYANVSAYIPTYTDLVRPQSVTKYLRLTLVFV